MKIFVVEDDPWYSELLVYHLSLNPDYQIQSYGTGKDLLDHMHEKPDVITLDYTLPDTNGAQMLKKIQSINPEVPVIMLSGQNDVGTAVNLLKEGAYDYIVKDDDARDRLWNTLIKIRLNYDLKNEINTLKDELHHKYKVEKSIIGKSPAIQTVIKDIHNACRTKINVIINGESGTGKEVVAKAIHYNSPQSKKPFIAVNVAAIPEDLIESELFGYEKGAFTGATTRKKGKLEEANDGTLFLDEIAEMGLSMQVKLLRVLQERELTRLGGNEIIPLNFRLITATHKSFEQEIDKGNFREDLYYRLMGMSIEIPPLRKRGDDVLLLAKHFADLFASENNLPKSVLLPETCDKLTAYHYPGNVRELRSVMELAVVLADNGPIKPEHIRFSPHKSPKSEELFEEGKTLKEYTMEIVENYLLRYNNNVILVANKLGIGKSTLYSMLKEKEADK